MTILDILKILASPAQHSHHPMIPKMSFPAFRDNYSPFNSMYTIKLRFHSFQKIISRIYKPIAKNNFKYLKISHSLFCIRYLYSIDTPHCNSFKISSFINICIYSCRLHEIKCMQASKVGSIPDLDLEGVNSLRLFIRAFYFKQGRHDQQMRSFERGYVFVLCLISKYLRHLI